VLNSKQIKELGNVQIYHWKRFLVSRKFGPTDKLLGTSHNIFNIATGFLSLYKKKKKNSASNVSLQRPFQNMLHKIGRKLTHMTKRWRTFVESKRQESNKRISISTQSECRQFFLNDKKRLLAVTNKHYAFKKGKFWILCCIWIIKLGFQCVCVWK